MWVVVVSANLSFQTADKPLSCLCWLYADWFLAKQWLSIRRCVNLWVGDFILRSLGREFCSTPMPLRATWWGHELERISWDEVVHLERLTAPPIPAAVVGLAGTAADMDGCKGDLVWERCIVAARLHIEKQSKEGDLGIQRCLWADNTG